MKAKRCNVCKKEPPLKDDNLCGPCRKKFDSELAQSLAELYSMSLFLSQKDHVMNLVKGLTFLEANTAPKSHALKMAEDAKTISTDVTNYIYTKYKKNIDESPLSVVISLLLLISAELKTHLMTEKLQALIEANWDKFAEIIKEEEQKDKELNDKDDVHKSYS